MPLKCGRRRSRTSLDRVDTVVSGVQRTPGPSRFSCVWNTETPSGSGALSGGPVSRPQGGPSSLAGQDAQEAKAGGRKAAGKRDDEGQPPLDVSYNWPDTGPGARTRKRADVWQVSL